MVLLLGRVHPHSTRKSPLSTLVPSFSPISPWIVAGDRRKLSGAGERFPLSLSFKPDRRGPSVSLYLFYNEPFSVAPLEIYVFPLGLRIISEAFSVSSVSPLENILFITYGSLDPFL